MARFCVLYGVAAVLGLACAEVLGDVVVGETSSNDPEVEVATSQLDSDLPALSPTPGGSEGLPMPALDPGDAGSRQDEPSSAAAPRKICERGDFRCSGADLELCLDGLGWMLWQACGSPRLCQSKPAGRCIPAPCAAGQQRCVQGSLQRCADDLGGYVEVESCVSAAHCDPRRGRCLSAPCTRGQRRCNGEQLEACSEDQLGWVPLRRCASEGLCESSSEPGGATCLDPRCDEGQFRCDEAGALQVCNRARTGFSNVAQCASAALCRADLGRCDAPACSPGQYACSPSGELLICNPALSGFRSQQPAVVCRATEMCDALRGRCQPIPQPGRSNDPPARN